MRSTLKIEMWVDTSERNHLLSSSPAFVKKSATENSQLNKKKTYRSVGRYSGSFSPPGSAHLKFSFELNAVILGDNVDPRQMYEIKEAEEGMDNFEPNRGVDRRLLSGFNRSCMISEPRDLRASIAR